MADFNHVPIMLEECMTALDVRPGKKVFLDMTAGGGGHSARIAHLMDGDARLICLDRDDDAIAACTERLSKITDRFTVVKSNFANVADVLDDLGIDMVDGVLFDLGVSSHQLDCPERGFSYMADAPLDMRMDASQSLTAYDVVNGYDEDRLAQILRDYGEERYSKQIARQIAKRRAERPIETTLELVEVIREAIPPKAQRAEAQHPAKRSFQAIRIEVNDEILAIAPAIEDVVERLRTNGRIAIITFHSGEDRVVKNTFRRLENPCTCPPDFPVCVCNKKPKIRTFKDITPTPDEIAGNPRARSARLRSAEKL